MLKKIILTTIVLGIVSCASKPSSIQPAAVSKLPYVNLSCEALEVSMDRESEKFKSSFWRSSFSKKLGYCA
tara:strand:- start:1718 stop:1930 length:213 start_codon:yes stop_codon:yes gene_type:complete